MSAPIDLTILVYETAIVFEGETDSYRYDLTGSGIVAGTQVADVIAEARGQLHAQWPNVTIQVKGPEEYCYNLVVGLQAENVTVVSDIDTSATDMADGDYDYYDDDVNDDNDVTYDPDGVDDDYEDSALQTSPSVTPESCDVDNTLLTSVFPRISHPNSPEATRGNIYLYLAIAGVIVLICGVSLWAVGPGSPPPTLPQASARPSPTSQLAAVPQKPASTSNTSTITMEHGNIQVGLPHDYRIEEQPDKPGMLIGRGADENLRVTMAIDPLFDADPTAIFAELDATINGDPTLTPAESLGIGRGQEKNYIENPGDGSTVHWIVWIDAGHVFSLGCHTRTAAANLPQRATCRKAAETLTIRH